VYSKLSRPAFGTHSAFHSIFIGSVYLEVEWSGRETDHLSSSDAEIRNACRWKSPPPPKWLNGVGPNNVQGERQEVKGVRDDVFLAGHEIYISGQFYSPAALFPREGHQFILGTYYSLFLRQTMET